MGLWLSRDLHCAVVLLSVLQVSQVDHEAVQATAVKVVFDLLHVFGFESFNLSTPSAAAAGSSAKRPNNKKKEEEEEEDSQADVSYAPLDLSVVSSGALCGVEPE